MFNENNFEISQGGYTMAVLDVNFYSNTLNRQVSYRAIIPMDEPLSYGVESKPFRKFKTLYLLHGMMGNYSDWVRNTNVNQLSHEYNIAVIMPSGDNSYYIDQKDLGNFYGEYVGRELVEETRKLLPLSNIREETFIAGLSMGGYGAVRNGLKYHATFGAIAGMSSLLIISEYVTKEPSRRNFFEAVFGKINEIKGSENDLQSLIKGIIVKKESMPKMYLSCGLEDFLLDNNRRFREFLISENVEHVYEESNGGHDWIFWNEYIEKVFKWLVQ